MRRAHVFLFAVLGACPRPSVPPPAGSAAARAGVDPCASDLSGTWVHSADPSWEYEAVDDGGTVDLLVWRRFDAGFSDAGATASMQLRRADGSFAGEVRALGGLPSGQTCPMTFPVRVTQCSDGGLTLLAAADGVIGEGCATPARPRNPAMLVHQLTRADAGGMRFSR